MTGHDHDREVELFGECVTCARVDPVVARRERDAALARVAQGTPASWVTAARTAVAELAATLPELTADDVWARVPHLDEPRAMGPIMVWASNTGLVTATDRTCPSTRPESHARPVRIWRSLTLVPSTLFDPE